MNDTEAAQWLWWCGYDFLAIDTGCHVMQAFIDRCEDLLGSDEYPDWRITAGCRECLACLRIIIHLDRPKRA